VHKLVKQCRLDHAEAAAPGRLSVRRRIEKSMA
jgi:hypothetical protein